MPNLVCVGAQWGDEGKGKIIDHLTPRADLVVRFQGGPNAGHTLVVDGVRTVLHLLPSGILHPDAVNVIGPGVVIDVDVLLGEIAALRERGIQVTRERLRVSDRAHVILPVHRSLDLAREESLGRDAIGTTGKGIGPAYEDRVSRSGLRVHELLEPDVLMQRLKTCLDERNFMLRELYHWPASDPEQVLDQAQGWAEGLAPYVDDVSVTLEAALREGRSVLLEGAQGTLLDIDHGTYPFVTSSTTLAGGACAGAGLGPTRIDSVLGITKAYTTRVGGGPFPTEDSGPAGRHMGEVGEEFGATTGRRRRCGWLDMVVLRHAVRVNGITSLAVLKLDVLTGLPEIRACVAYRVPEGVEAERGSRERLEFPASSSVLEKCEPVYRTFPGWSECIRDVTEFDALPQAARDYLRWIEDELEVPASLVGVGPDRGATIERADPFDTSRTA
ncbi:MAG: adenylosuccinate synthase [Myxococcota bacterium]